MENIIRRLYLGDDKDVERSKEKDYARLACCKEGPDSHRSMLEYKTLGAPKDKDYYFARKGDWMALNLIDVDDPEMIPDKVIDAGLRFIKEQMDSGKTVFVHCNAGMSRSPSIVFMYLRATGELPYGFIQSEKIFRTIYPKYDPAVGMRSHARVRWESLPTFFKG